MIRRFYLLLITLGMTLSGCSNSHTKIHTYLDKQFSNYDDIELSFSDIGIDSYISSQCYINFSLELTNKGTKTIEFNYDDAHINNDSNNNEIIVGNKSGKITLEHDVQKQLYFTATLPSSYDDEKYTFSLTSGLKEILFHMYEMPDDMRQQFEVKYVVNGEVVKTNTVHEGKELGQYEWMSSDTIYGCRQWRLDVSSELYILPNYRVYESLTLYGNKTPCLYYDVISDSDYSFVKGVVFVPNSGELFIPKMFEGKQVQKILSGALNRTTMGIKTVYIPETINFIDSDNFSYCGDLETIYFEGSEEEWQSINKAAVPPYTRVVFNTYK